VNASSGSGCGYPPVAPCGSVSELTASSGYSAGFNISSDVYVVPEAIALDASGNLWIANTYLPSVIEWYAGSGYTAGYNHAAGVGVPNSVAIDGSGDVFVGGFWGSEGLTEFVGGAQSPTVFSGLAGTDFAGMALDSAGDVWVGEYDPGGAVRSPAASNYSSPTAFSPGGGSFESPTAVAVDSANNVWVANQGGLLSELRPAITTAALDSFRQAPALEKRSRWHWMPAATSGLPAKRVPLAMSARASFWGWPVRC